MVIPSKYPKETNGEEMKSQKGVGVYTLPLTKWVEGIFYQLDK